jgi:hypothetical protein
MNGPDAWHNPGQVPPEHRQYITRDPADQYYPYRCILCPERKMENMYRVGEHCRSNQHTNRSQWAAPAVPPDLPPGFGVPAAPPPAPPDVGARRDVQPGDGAQLAHGLGGLGLGRRDDRPGDGAQLAQEDDGLGRRDDRPGDGAQLAQGDDGLGRRDDRPGDGAQLAQGDDGLWRRDVRPGDGAQLAQGDDGLGRRDVRPDDGAANNWDDPRWVPWDDRQYISRAEPADPMKPWRCSLCPTKQLSCLWNAGEHCKTEKHGRARGWAQPPPVPAAGWQAHGDWVAQHDEPWDRAPAHEPPRQIPREILPGPGVELLPAYLSRGEKEDIRQMFAMVPHEDLSVQELVEILTSAEGNRLLALDLLCQKYPTQGGA